MTAAIIATVLALFCGLGAAAILLKEEWWRDYKMFGWILIAIAILLLIMAAWGLALPDQEMPAG